MAQILVAEDEAAVRDFVRRALELDGHTVLAVEDGAQALGALKRGHAANLVLTDIKMPVMDGIALALSVARDWPDLPILLMTGYADQRERAAGLDDLIKDVLTKPFELATLQGAVRRALAA